MRLSLLFVYLSTFASLSLLPLLACGRGGSLTERSGLPSIDASAPPPSGSFDGGIQGTVDAAPPDASAASEEAGSIRRRAARPERPRSSRHLHDRRLRRLLHQRGCSGRLREGSSDVHELGSDVVGLDGAARHHGGFCDVPARPHGRWSAGPRALRSGPQRARLRSLGRPRRCVFPLFGLDSTSSTTKRT